MSNNFSVQKLHFVNTVYAQNPTRLTLTTQGGPRTATLHAHTAGVERVPGVEDVTSNGLRR